MKRIVVLMALLAAVAISLPAQVSFAQASTKLYTVYAEGGQAAADEIAAKLDGLFGLYNGYFRFDPSTLKTNLIVRVFSTKTTFDEYLVKVVKETREDFVFLRYPTPEKNELVLFNKENADDFDASLAHQAFVQFLNSFISNPPMWMQEGFAVFFEQARWDAEKKAVQFQENTAWLETVKTLKAQEKLFDVKALIGMSKENAKTNIDIFYCESWVFVSFLVNSDDKRYNRFLWDSVILLGRDASYDENIAAINARFDLWHTKESATADFHSFIDVQKTFPELVNLGVVAYGEKKYEEAKEYFLEAIKKNDQNYAPYYYLGLIAYAKNDYALADYYYKSSLQLGSDAATTNYALGVNAFASNRFDDASAFLQSAKTAAPDRYGARVDEILEKMK